MITKKLITRLSIALTLGASIFATSNIASAHDNGHHHEWRDHHDHGYRHGHWRRDYYQPREVVRVYERDRYVVPSYNYQSRPRYNDGLTIIYRDNWR